MQGQLLFQVCLGGAGARVFLHLEGFGRRLIADGEPHLIGAGGDGGTGHGPIGGDITIDFVGIGVTHIPDKAIQSGLFRRVWFALFLLFLLVFGVAHWFALDLAGVALDLGLLFALLFLRVSRWFAFGLAGVAFDLVALHIKEGEFDLALRFAGKPVVDDHATWRILSRIERAFDGDAAGTLLALRHKLRVVGIAEEIPRFGGA